MGCASSRDDTADAKPTSVTDVTPNMTTPTKKPMAKARASTPELRAAEESKAATAVAAAYRGHAGRAKAANIKAPCNTYRLNLKSESFGDCQCGWSKASHSPAALLAGGAGKPSAKRQASAKELPASFFEKAAAECTRYEVNMKSANFGECVCGWPRAQHSAAALAAASLKEEKTTCMDAEELRKQFVQKELAACTKYVVNMQAANFGECVCGRPKAEHTAAALGGDQAEATRRRSKSTTMSTEQEAKLRKQMSAKGLSTGCAKYQARVRSGHPRTRAHITLYTCITHTHRSTWSRRASASACAAG